MTGNTPAYADLLIRIRALQNDGYPIEITLNSTQALGEGYLPASVMSWLPSGDLTADGEWLFNELFPDGELRSAWDFARGGFPHRRIRLCLHAPDPALHPIPWETLRLPGKGGVTHHLADLCYQIAELLTKASVRADRAILIAASPQVPHAQN